VLGHSADERDYSGRNQNLKDGIFKTLSDKFPDCLDNSFFLFVGSIFFFPGLQVLFVADYTGLLVGQETLRDALDTLILVLEVIKGDCYTLAKLQVLHVVLREQVS
jgi:hypothetical protein